MLPRLSSRRRSLLVLVVCILIGLFFAGVSQYWIGLAVGFLGVLSSLLGVAGTNLKDLFTSKKSEPKTSEPPPSITQKIQIGDALVTTEFRGVAAIAKYQDGTSRLLLFQHSSAPPDVVIQAAKLVYSNHFEEGESKAKDAIRLLEGTTITDADHFLSQVYLLIGDSRSGRERYAEAEEYYSLSIRLAKDPRFKAASLRGLASSKGFRGRHAEALADLEASLKLDPKDDRAWYNKGVALGALGRNEEALLAYDECIRINPKNVSAWDNKGTVMGALGRHEEAVKAHKRSLDLDPSYLRAWHNMSVDLNALGRYDESLVSSDTALKLDPTNASAWNDKAIALRGLDKFDEALKAIDTALRCKPKSMDAWSNKAAILANLNRPDEALASLEEALKLDPKNELLWSNKALFLSTFGKHEEAFQAVEEALRLNPRNATARLAESYSLIRLKKFEKAVKACDEAIKLNPKENNIRTAAWFYRAITLRSAGRNREALKSINNALRIAPNDATLIRFKNEVAGN